MTPGSKLGIYEIVAPLGAGGMGEVYRAPDTRLGRDVAIKALAPQFAQDPDGGAVRTRGQAARFGIAPAHRGQSSVWKTSRSIVTSYSSSSKAKRWRSVWIAAHRPSTSRCRFCRR
jgi:serine/threonine protein kinase